MTQCRLADVGEQVLKWLVEKLRSSHELGAAASFENVKCLGLTFMARYSDYLFLLSMHLSTRISSPAAQSIRAVVIDWKWHRPC